MGWVINDELQRCFEINDAPDEKTRFFYLKIFSEKIDTIRLETNITGYGNNPCVNFPIFTYDIFLTISLFVLIVLMLKFIKLKSNENEIIYIFSNFPFCGIARTRN